MNSCKGVIARKPTEMLTAVILKRIRITRFDFVHLLTGVIFYKCLLVFNLACQSIVKKINLIILTKILNYQNYGKVIDQN